MGASSGIGRLAVDEALSRHLPVRAFARSADTLPHAEGLEPVAADALDLDAVRDAVDGARAVIYTLGIKESLSMLWQEVTLFSQTTQILLDAMAQTGVTRLVVVTGIGAGRSRTALSTLERAAQSVILGKPYADKDRQEDLIMQSQTDWTIVRPVILTNGQLSKKYKVLRGMDEWRNGLISRRDVAHYLVDAATQDLDIKKDVVLAR